MKTQTRITSCADLRPIGRVGSRLLLLLAMALSTTLASGAIGAERGAKPDQSLTKKSTPTVKKEAAMNASPVSTQQLWERLLILLAEDHGFTPKDRVEAVLGIRFTHSEKESDPPKIGAANRYKLEVELPELGLFKVTLFDDPLKTGLVIDWGRPNAVTNQCLSLKELAMDMGALGWVEVGRRINRPGRGFSTFGRPNELKTIMELGRGFDPKKGDSTVDLLSPSQSSDCVDGVSIDVWRHPTR